MNDPTVTDLITTDDVRYDIETINMFLSKIIPYNVKSYYPLHKFWVYVDKCVVTKNSYYNKTIHITIALTLNSECIKQIKEIEKHVNDKLENDKITIDHKIETKLEDSGNFVPTFQVILDNNSKLFEETNVEFKNPKYVNIKDCLELVCELDYFLVGNNSVKPIWRIVHLKKFELINLKVPIFSKIKKSPHYQPIQHTTQHNLNHASQIYPNHPIHSITQNNNDYFGNTKNNNFKLEQKPQQNTNILNNQNTKPKISFMPSLSDLQNAMSGLKKIKKESNDEDPIQKLPIAQILPEKIELKHVETKESNPIEMLKNEHKLKVEQKMNSDHENLLKIEKLRKKELKYKKKLYDDIH